MRLVRLGWLADAGSAIIGGAELSAATLAAQPPSWAELVPCPPGRVADCEAYVVQNCVSYSRADMEQVYRRPFVLCVRDYWHGGDRFMRLRLLARAEVVIFDSEPHREEFVRVVPQGDQYRDYELCPPPVDVARYRTYRYGAAAEVIRQGTFWIGQMYPHKGIAAAVAWAHEHGPVDFYGEGPHKPAATHMVRLKGQVPHEQTPAVMVQYERFLFMPEWVEPYGKTVIEAWAAGCKLEVSGRIGALWWLAHEPDAVKHGVERFWAIVEAYL